MAEAEGEEHAEDEDDGPTRRCIVTGDRIDRDLLLRFVVGPTGEIVPDVAARLPGRGLWLTPERDIVERAVTKRLFARAARRAVTVSPDLADRIEALLAQRCCDALGLARRAGIAVAGFDKVSESVRSGKAGLILGALDGAEGGRGKIEAIGRDLPVASVLTTVELGAAFGRDRVVHASVGRGPLCVRLLRDAARMTGFRTSASVARGTKFAPAQPARQNGGTEAR